MYICVHDVPMTCSRPPLAQRAKSTGSLAMANTHQVSMPSLRSSAEPDGFNELSTLFYNAMAGIQQNVVLVGSPKYGTEMFGRLFNAATLGVYNEILVSKSPRSMVPDFTLRHLRALRRQGVSVSRAQRSIMTSAAEEIVHLMWLRLVVPRALDDASSRFIAANGEGSSDAVKKVAVIMARIFCDPGKCIGFARLP